MKKFFKKIFNRNFLIILLLAVQALFMLACFFKLYEYTNLIYGAQTIHKNDKTIDPSGQKHSI